MNISGVIVYAVPDKSDSISNDLNAIDGVDVHAAEDGKLVETVEHENINGCFFLDSIHRSQFDGGRYRNAGFPCPGSPSK